jgi:hypothetical protein
LAAILESMEIATHIEAASASDEYPQRDDVLNFLDWFGECGVDYRTRRNRKDLGMLDGYLPGCFSDPKPES